jgi:hypothetical protein
MLSSRQTITSPLSSRQMIISNIQGNIIIQPDDNQIFRAVVSSSHVLTPNVKEMITENR